MDGWLSRRVGILAEGARVVGRPSWRVGSLSWRGECDQEALQDGWERLEALSHGPEWSGDMPESREWSEVLPGESELLQKGLEWSESPAGGPG